MTSRIPRRRAAVAALVVAALAGSEAVASEAARLYAALADERAAEGLPAHHVHPRLETAAQARAEGLALAVERRGDGGGDLRSLGEPLETSLREAGYAADRVEALHVLGADTLRSTLFDIFGTPSTFREAFFAEELPDLGVGAAWAGDRPVYVVLLALSRSQAFARQTVGLDDLETVRAELLERVNAVRLGEERGPLVPNACLEAAAQEYAERLLAEGFFGHVTPEGEGVMDRLEHAGCRMREASENLASGPASAEEAIEGWLDSPSHRRALLGKAYREVGHGIARGASGDRFLIVWVQLLGRR